MTDPAMATHDPTLHLDPAFIFDALFAETWGSETTWNDLKRQPWWDFVPESHARHAAESDGWPNADTDMPTQELRAITEEEQ